MKRFLRNNLITLVGIVIGSIAGFLYWKLVGCNSGTCSITSKPINSTLYGAVLGGLLFSIFQKTPKNERV